MVSIHVLATPISGLVRSSSVKPIALNMARDGARSRPSVIRRLRCLRSIGLKDYDTVEEIESRRAAFSCQLLAFSHSCNKKIRAKG